MLHEKRESSPGCIVPIVRCSRTRLRRRRAMSLRVLVADDSAFMRKVISQILASDPSIKVVDTARNGQEAVDKAKLLKPDLITLDIEMPVMDGLAALKKIRLECPEPRPAVLMCSTLTSAGSHEALRALRLGASDVIAKDANLLAGNASTMQAELLGKVRAILEHRVVRLPGAPGTAAASAVKAGGVFKLGNRPVGLVLIGSSTGGPPVLEKILTRLPADFPVPVVVAQHMPAMFTKSVAERLDQTCAITVVHGDQEYELHPGTAYISQGGRHGRVVRRGGKLYFNVSDEPAAALYRPSVNELFSSAAKCDVRGVLAMVLTGMGDDGSVGAKELRAAGGVIVAQDAASCVVYGMPRAVVENGAAEAALTPDELTAVLVGLSPSQSKGRAA